MIAKNGDKVIVTRDAEYDDGFVLYEIGERGVMLNKAEHEDAGGWVSLDSGKVVYLFKDEYVVLLSEEFSENSEVAAVTAESLRIRFLEIKKEEEEISKKIDTLSEEKSKIEDDLRAMGFMLCSPVIEEFAPIIDDTPPIEYSDWRNWKKGDMIEYVNDGGWDDNFVSGGLYEVVRVNTKGVWVESERVNEQDISLFIKDFKFHSPF